jgi:poly(hydroxyalkanoate) granule-associated protein
MATKKKSSPRPRARARVKTDRAQAAGKRIRETWKATVKVLSSAEQKKAARQIESQLSALQGRLQREKKDLGRVVDETVRGTLVALNIPSRREVSELTRKVDELSRKIDGYRRSSSTRGARRRSAGASA